MQPNLRPLRAFTLIELLVVVSILALLLAILLPAMGAARDAAVRLKCINRVGQIMLGTAAYAVDHRNQQPDRTYAWLPHAIGPGTSSPSLVGNDLNPFVRDYLLERNVNLFCPSRLSEARNPDTDQYATGYVTYQYRGDLDEPTDITRPSGVWLIPPSRAEDRPASYTVWTCLTTENQNNGLHLGHDTPGLESAPPGQSAASADGAARWVEWNRLTPYLNSAGLHFMIPTP